MIIFLLFFMIIIGELGWEVNHGEIFLATPEDGTPQIWSHIHMVLNHFPTIGFVFALFFYIVGIVLNNDVMKRSGLVAFVACAILGASTYVTGASAMWALTSPDKFRDVSQAMINEHRDWALITLFGLAFTGGLAWIELWRYRYLGKFSKVTINTVLVFALVTLAVMAETGHRGGQINHPEIRLATDVFATDPTIQWSPQIELLINNVEYFVPWQTVHFFGYTMVFAVVMMVSLRIFGFWKSIPFSAVRCSHKARRIPH